MIIIRRWAELEPAFGLPIDEGIKGVLRLRRRQLEGYGEIVRFMIVEPGDDPHDMEPCPLINIVDGRRFGDAGFTPSWEAIEDHGGACELTFVLSDEGSGVVIFVPCREGIDPDLLKLCRTYAGKGA